MVENQASEAFEPGTGRQNDQNVVDIDRICGSIETWGFLGKKKERENHLGHFRQYVRRGGFSSGGSRG